MHNSYTLGLVDLGITFPTARPSVIFLSLGMRHGDGEILTARESIRSDFHKACGQNDFLQRRAALKGSCADFNKPLVQNDFFKRGASRKGIRAKVRYGFGNFDFRKRRATRKGAATDINQSFEKIHARNLRAIGEGGFSNAENLFFTVICAEIDVSRQIFISADNFRIVLMLTRGIDDSLRGFILPNRLDHHILCDSLIGGIPSAQIRAILHRNGRISVLPFRDALLQRAAEQSSSVQIEGHYVCLFARKKYQQNENQHGQKENSEGQ